MEHIENEVNETFLNVPDRFPSMFGGCIVRSHSTVPALSFNRFLPFRSPLPLLIRVRSFHSSIFMGKMLVLCIKCALILKDKSGGDPLWNQCYARTAKRTALGSISLNSALGL
jgi:hypothetical protein